MLLNIVVLRHVCLDVGVCDEWGPQDFNTLHSEHIRGEILLNVLKVRVVLQEKLSPIIYVSRGSALSQDHNLTQKASKVGEFLKNTTPEVKGEEAKKDEFRRSHLVILQFNISRNLYHHHKNKNGRWFQVCVQV